MKIQDVMLQAMAKKITWWQAAEILGISDRHMRRWRERYEQEGYNGLLDRRRGKPSRRRVPLATVEKVLGLYREKYYDLNVQHFHEKLEAEHGVELSYTWVKQALQGAGMVARGHRRGVHRKRRARRPLPGMLLHIDGSRHQWLQDERWYDLIVMPFHAVYRHPRSYSIPLVLSDRILIAISNFVMAAPISGCSPIFSSRAFRIWRAFEICAAACSESRLGLGSLAVSMAAHSPAVNIFGMVSCTTVAFPRRPSIALVTATICSLLIIREWIAAKKT
jgi:transposase